MHETLRRRILRRLETLPEGQLYQVLDYIEFLESRYGRTTPPDASGLQRLAERLEDGLRRRTVNPSNLREAFHLIAAADRVLSSVSEAGREILGELQAAPQPPPSEGAGDGPPGRASAASGIPEKEGGEDAPSRGPPRG